MQQLSNEQLNSLDRETLVILVTSLQDQLLALRSQLDKANATLEDNNRQIELLSDERTSFFPDPIAVPKPARPSTVWLKLQRQTA